MAATTSTQTVISQEPAWMEAYRRGLIEDVKGVAGTANTIPEYQVAGLAPEQIQAVQMAKEGIGSYKPYLAEAGQSYGQAGEAYQNAAQLGLAGAQQYDPNAVTQYMNPYQQQVTQASLAEMNRQAAIQNQGVSAQAAKAGAYGGARFGVQEAELGRNLADVQGRQILSDYSQNYSQAQQAAMNAFQNQQARTQAAGQMSLGAGQGIAGLGGQQAALGQMTSALGQGDVSFQYNIGQNLQQQNQKVLEAQRMNQQLYNQEPYQRLSYYADILNKTPSGQSATTQTSVPQASPFSQIAGLGIAGLGAYNASKSAGLWGGA